jgi:bacteriocin-like protein
MRVKNEKASKKAKVSTKLQKKTSKKPDNELFEKELSETELNRITGGEAFCRQLPIPPKPGQCLIPRK